MKHLFTILLFSLFIISANAQARIGSTAQEIKNEFSENIFTSGITTDGTKYISTSFQRATVGYYLDDNNLCNLVIIIPLTQGDLNFYVETYNKQYVIISNTEWKAYFNNGGVMHIKLVYDSDYNDTYFSFY